MKDEDDEKDRRWNIEGKNKELRMRMSEERKGRGKKVRRKGRRGEGDEGKEGNGRKEGSRKKERNDIVILWEKNRKRRFKVY